MRQDPIVIQPYDPAWPSSFATQKAALESELTDVLVAPTQHIGSTSVPGLAAKPIIDMLALVDDYAAFTEAPQRLEHLSWVAAPEPGDADRRTWSLCFPSVERRTHHLHVVEQASPAWRDWVLFRDYLRAHPDDARRYARLKHSLAATDARDRPAYRAGKGPVIAELMDLARDWQDRQNDVDLNPG